MAAATAAARHQAEMNSQDKWRIYHSIGFVWIRQKKTQAGYSIPLAAAAAIYRRKREGEKHLYD